MFYIHIAKDTQSILKKVAIKIKYVIRLEFLIIFT